VIINKELSLNLPIVKDERLIEFGGGALEGKSGLTADQRMVYFANRVKYGIELLPDAFNRVKSFFDEIKSKNLENVLVVSHAGIIKMMLYHAKYNDFDESNLDNNNYMNIIIENAQIIRWE